MRRRGVLACAAVVALVPGARALAAPADHGPDAMAMPTTVVGMGYADFRPQAVHVLVGDHVRWTNGSVRAHTVTAEDGRFASGRVFPGDTYERMIDTAGTVAYRCDLHAGMRGTLTASVLLLDVPVTAAAPGRPYPLEGRTALPPGTPVTLQADAGEGFADVATATVDADGRFAGSVRATRPATYRAVAGEHVSPGVAVRVLGRTVRVGARPSPGGGDRILVHVSPPDPGATVVLQLRLPERFGWWPVRVARLDRRGSARFSVRVGRRLAARVRLTLSDAATPLATSRTVHVGRARR